MMAKLQKEFTLVIGTNDTTKSMEDLVDAALKLEQCGNSPGTFPMLRVHIFEKKVK